MEGVLSNQCAETFSKINGWLIWFPHASCNRWKRSLDRWDFNYRNDRTFLKRFYFLSAVKRFCFSLLKRLIFFFVYCRSDVTGVEGSPRNFGKQ